MLRFLDTAIGFAVVMLLLSLLITSIVQSVAALFNLRGSNLKWGLELLLGQVDPTLSKKVRSEIAEKVLTHPAVASAGLFGKNRRAVAIRVEELFRVLRQIKDANIQVQNVTVTQQSPADPKAGPTDPSKELRAMALSRDASTRLASLVGEPLIDAARIDQLATDIAKAVPQDAALLRAAMVQIFGKTDKVIAGVSDWFDSVMDRTSQRFAMHTRLLSVIAAIGLTLGLRLDTPGVLNRIWSSGALREQLVATVPDALLAADTIRAYERRQETLATSAIVALRERQQDSTLRALLTRVPALGTHADGADWLGRQLAKRTDSAAVLQAYRQQMATRTDSLLTGFANSSKRARALLGDPGIGIFQTPLPAFGAYWGDFDHIVRGLISVVLLSLGAPFWYNALRNTANLRPVVAARVAEETKAKSN